MRKILFVSYYGDGADIALRMAIEPDTQVLLWIDDPKFRGNFDGVIDKPRTFQEGERWASMLVYDDNKCVHLKTKKPKFGGTEFCARLEDDRKFTQDLCKRAGINVGAHKSFKTGVQVIAHLKENPGAWVVKPQGGKADSWHLIVGSVGHDEETIQQVQRLVDSKLQVDSWEVEEKFEGIEVAVSRWCNGRDWIGPININFEHKHINEKETGALCGEAGTLMKYVEDPKLPLFEETLAKLLPALRAADFRGQIDLNLIVDKDGVPHLIEATPRLGKPSVFIEHELHITPWSELFYACATGGDLNMQVRWDWAVGVVLFAFGFPHEKVAIEASQGLPVNGLPASLAHIHPMQLRRDKKGDWKVGYGEGYLLVATGRGPEIYDAKRAAYDAMAPIRVPNASHRFDITEKINKYELQELGILDESEEPACVAVSS